MRALIILVFALMLLIPPMDSVTQAQRTVHDNSYILVGGQNGTWFEPGQSPRLFKIFLQNDSVTQLTPVTGQGTVWGGGWNGSQWLTSGWGVDSGTSGSNPYIYLYNGEKQVVAGSLDQYVSESSWHGGDIFAASYNGKEWLLSGMGSEPILTPTDGPYDFGNHMSLATFDGNNFTDLSTIVPEQGDAILYTNAWNGSLWMVGGGYYSYGTLFTFDGSNITDLTTQINMAVASFGSVLSVRWNGSYWLIGGYGFLAKYDGHNFQDLTRQLYDTISNDVSSTLVVNAITWNGSSWMIGGGSMVAEPQQRQAVAWIASYGTQGFRDLTTSLPTYISKPIIGSSILTISYVDNTWILGGFSDSSAILLLITPHSFTDLSYLIGPTTSYVIWIGGVS
ncbi:MAG: hypothetical protein ACLPY5_00735 [Candidatus Bathyarchaeia archaeon]